MSDSLDLSSAPLRLLGRTSVTQLLILLDYHRSDNARAAGRMLRQSLGVGSRRKPEDMAALLAMRLIMKCRDGNHKINLTVTGHAAAEALIALIVRDCEMVSHRESLLTDTMRADEGMRELELESVEP